MANIDVAKNDFFNQIFFPRKKEKIPSNIQRGSIDQDFVQRLTFYQSLSKKCCPNISHYFFNIFSVWFSIIPGALIFQMMPTKCKKSNVFHALLIGFGEMGHFFPHPSFSEIFLFSAEVDGGGSIICFLGWKCSLGANWWEATWRHHSLPFAART